MSLYTPDGRRAWAFVAIWIGCIVFTTFAAVGVWLVSAVPLYSLILALAAHLQLLLGMGAFGFILGRRMRLDISRDGARIRDENVPDAATGAQVATNAAAAAAQGVTDALSIPNKEPRP